MIRELSLAQEPQKIPMKYKLIRHFVLASLALFSTAILSANADPTPAQQAQIDSLKKTYTATSCPVSGDNLAHNDMGTKPVDYLYTQKNADGTETTRLVRFCCKDCVTKFKRNPEKYLKTPRLRAPQRPPMGLRNSRC
jgi:hypothetical protein